MLYNNLKLISLILLLLASTITLAQNKLAILPFGFTHNGHISVEEGKQAQQFLIQYIQKKQKHFKVTVMNARSINVVLHTAGITMENVDDFTIKEIADVVEADYILIGSIDKTLQGSSSSNFNAETSHKKNSGVKNTFGGSTGSTTDTYEATVYISIFEKDGTPIYDNNKSNIFLDNTSTSWKNSIIWQVRHFPLYKK